MASVTVRLLCSLSIALATIGIILAAFAFDAALYPAQTFPSESIVVATSGDASTFSTIPLDEFLYAAPVTRVYRFKGETTNLVATFWFNIAITRWGDMRFFQATVEPATSPPINGSLTSWVTASFTSTEFAHLIEKPWQYYFGINRFWGLYKVNDVWRGGGLHLATAFRFGRREASVTSGRYNGGYTTYTELDFSNATFSVPSQFASWQVVSPRSVARTVTA